MPRPPRPRRSAAHRSASSPQHAYPPPKSRALNARTEKTDPRPRRSRPPGTPTDTIQPPGPTTPQQATNQPPLQALPPAAVPRRPGFSHPPPRRDQPQEGRSPRDASSLTVDTKAQRLQPQRSRCCFPPAVGKNWRNRGSRSELLPADPHGFSHPVFRRALLGCPPLTDPAEAPPPPEGQLLPSHTHPDTVTGHETRAHPSRAGAPHQRRRKGTQLDYSGRFRDGNNARFVSEPSPHIPAKQGHP